MPVDHGGELLVGLESLPFEARAPLLKEPSRPRLAFLAPQLAEGLLEQIGDVQPLVRREQGLKRLAALQSQVLAARQQGVFLALDVTPLPVTEPGVLALADFVQCRTQVAHDVELVVQDRRLRRLPPGRVVKWLPHVHHREPQAVALFRPQPGIKLVHRRLRTVLPAKPDRTSPHEVTHHDAVGVARADRDLINADHLGGRVAGTRQLRRHVLLLQLLDRMPVEFQLRCNVLDARAPATTTHVPGETLRVERVVRQERQPLAFHRSAAPTVNPSDFQLEVDPSIAAGQVPHPSRRAVVPTTARLSAGAAAGFFPRRMSVITRTRGSPKTPRTVACGRNPENAYASTSRRVRLREVAIRPSCQIPRPLHQPFRPAIAGLNSCSYPNFHPHSSAKTLILLRMGTVYLLLQGVSAIPVIAVQWYSQAPICEAGKVKTWAL